MQIQRPVSIFAFNQIDEMHAIISADISLSLSFFLSLSLFLSRSPYSITILPALAFENLNSLETLNIQNNKLVRIPEEVMEPIMDTLRVVDIMGEFWGFGRLLSAPLLISILFLDNPLICSCELMWFPNLLQDLKDRDDEMTQKKRPMCTMVNEHREYFVQSMPIERMNCITSPGANRMNDANMSHRQHINILCTILTLSLSITHFYHF